ncbi:MAG: DUF2169 domain-containing protein [Polyangiaceae bacterium]
MKIIKPNFVTPIPAVFDDGRRLRLVVSAIFHATFDGELCEERLLWPFAKDEVEGSVLDEGQPKSKAEFLVHGSCYARGPDVRQSFVKVKVAELEKTLAVFGKRTFKLGVASAPEPFEAVPIRWTHAFGGNGYAENPSGVGYKDGALPQVELLGQLIKSPDDRPQIAGFGRLDFTLPQRMKKLGTYDQKWLKTRYPGLAEDVDMTYFQLAPADQWRAEFFAGHDAFSVVNMHPEKAQQDGKLPGVVARVFVKRTGEPWVDVPMHLDTVHLFPHLERQVLVCRGGTTTKSDTLDDIEAVGLGLEWIGRPKSREHYEAIFAARSRKDGAAFAALDDTGLLPEQPPKKKERIVAPGEGLKARQVQRSLRHKHEEVKRLMIENDLDLAQLPALPEIDLSVDPDEVPPPPNEPPTLDEAKRGVAEKRKEMLANAKQQLEDGLDGFPAEEAARVRRDFDEAAKKLETEEVGPPALAREKFREDLLAQKEMLENINADASRVAAQLEDERTDQQLRALDDMACETYRTMVQHQGVPPALGPEASAAARTRAQIRYDAGEPFARFDLTGADLSGMDLTNADLRGAWLEATKLVGAKLDGANLTNAVLARADLTGVDLSKSKLTGANFSEANLTRANLGACDLTGCFFVRSDLTQASLTGATLNDVDLTAAKLTRADLSRTKLEKALLFDLVFEDTNLEHVLWDKTTFYRCHFVRASARRATMSLVLFVDSTLEAVRFDDAKLTKAQAAKIDAQPRFVGCSFVGARVELGMFRGASFETCDFRHSDFEKTDFSKATMDGTHFEDARGVGARFVGASVRDCRFDRADLVESLFGSALMDRASFARANLFRADFGRSGGDAVDMSGANVKRVRTIPKREEAP